MSLNGILAALSRREEWRRHLESVAGSAGAQEITVRPGGHPAYVGALWQRQLGPILVITPRPEDARRLHDQLLTYVGEDGPIYLLPEPEVLPFERLAVDAHTTNQRLSALAALGRSGDGGPFPAVVTSVGGALLKTLPPEVVRGGNDRDVAPYRLAPGQAVAVGRLLSQWVDLGYRHEPLVEGPGCFSHRGGIIDVYPPHCELPFRIELWDDEVDTIRLFDPSTQRSVGAADEVRLIPAREQLPAEADPDAVDRLRAAMDFTRCAAETKERMDEEMAHLFSAPHLETLSFYNGLLNHAGVMDYLPENGLVVVERDSQVESEGQDLEERFERMRTAREDRGELPLGFPSPYVSWKSFASTLQSKRRVLLKGWVSSEEDRIFRPAAPYYGRLEQLVEDARRCTEAGAAVVVVTQHVRRIADLLEEGGAPVSVSGAIEEPPQPGSIHLVAGSLREGWTVGDTAMGSPDEFLSTAPYQGDTPVDPDPYSLVLLTDAELLGTVKERRQRRTTRAELGPQVVLADLAPGSYVVHVDHGVALFTGTTNIGEDGEDKEYLVLEYAEQDKLYVPTGHLDRVTAYLGAQDRPPTLTRLSAMEWARVKERVKGATRELARELLQLQAARQAAKGHEFGPDTTWQSELEDSFPYEETRDQAVAIDQVKADMEAPKPMDRLICGDVGYGKTEVALRAAFKSVSDGMQVGMLVPTTVLAQQHYATFGERLSPFPVRVEVLSRFRTPKEQQEVIEGLKDGSVDIVIGTHRLLQKDVSFKNLGLAVVDEEQRFGVYHKEQLKKLREELDVLTLSATPIPRTLHQALSGIRDLSTMDTPPEARLPVKTFVSEYSEDVIKEAVLREMERGGQVFFLHNRVKTIDQTATEIGRMVPEARIMVAHGQMHEEDLAGVMASFSDGEADVLVCTTIIESGLDMPNVNTLILDRADRFGLSQLYQLRGRVGRGDHRAYAYLLVPRGRRITEAAEQRVQAILEAAELGSGFRIAMRDMEIRGAGNLLGAAQSGHIHEVGLDLYSQLLQEAVRELGEAEEDGQQPPQAPVDLPRIDLPLNAGIPDSYVSHMASRLGIYQRVARITDRGVIPQLRNELQDRFGPVPQETENLLLLADLRVMGGTLNIESIHHNDEAIVLTLKSPVGGAKAALQKALGPAARVGNQQVHLAFRRLEGDWLPRFIRILGRFMAFQERLSSLS